MIDNQFKNILIIPLAVSVVLFNNNSKIRSFAPVFIVGITYLLHIFGLMFEWVGLVFISLLVISALIFGNTVQRFGLSWFLAGFLPLLVVSLSNVQSTYLAESNIGMSIFIGSAMCQFASSLKPSGKIIKIIGFCLIGLLIITHISGIYSHLESADEYHKSAIDCGAVFEAGVHYLVENVADNGTVYYLDYERHQIDIEHFDKLLYLEGRGDINAVSVDTLEINQSTGHIALMSLADVVYFQEQNPQLNNLSLYSEIKYFITGDNIAMISELKTNNNS